MIKMFSRPDMAPVAEDVEQVIVQMMKDAAG
jgi:hypothetical protein